MADEEVLNANAEQGSQDTGADQGATPAQDQPTQNDSDTVQGLKAAVSDERAKRQALEARLAQVQQAPQAGQQQPVQQGQQPNLLDKFWDDPLSVLNAVQQQTRTDVRNEMSEMIVKERVGAAEYAQKIKHFANMAQTDPSLVMQMNASQNPAQFAYNKAKADLAGLNLSDPDAIYQKALADAKAQLQREIEDKIAGSDQSDAGADQSQSLPNSFADAPGGGGVSSDNVRPDTSLAALYKR